MLKQITRRNFLKLSLIGGSMGILSSLEILASDEKYFTGKNNEKFHITELYSKGMIFSEKEPNISLGNESNLTYFVQNNNNVNQIDDIQFDYSVLDMEDKSKEFHAIGFGYVTNGIYQINKNIQTKGNLFKNPIMQGEFEKTFSDELKSFMELYINDSLIIFNKNLNQLCLKQNNLKPVPKNYNPFEIKYKKMKENIKEGQEYIV